MNVYAPILLCFVPFITMFLLFAILAPGISVLREFAASLAGLVAFIPIVLLQFLIPELRLFHQVKFISILLYSILFCGFIEEGFKAASLLILKAKGETLRNFFLYSLLAGMVLGCFESVVYLLFLVQSGTSKFLPLKLIYLRMGTALVIHTLCAGLGGLCVFHCKNIRRNFIPLLFAVLIHGVYDFFVAFDTSLKYFSVAVILLAALECRIIYVRTREELASAAIGGQKIADPNRTIEMPKNPALVISVKNTIPNKEENNMFFNKKKSDAEDFDAIQKEAEANLKKDKETAAKKAAEKTAVMKTSAKKTADKKAAATKKTAAAKKATAKKTVAKKATATKKSATKKVAAKKAAVKKSAATAKKTAAKKATTAKKTVAKKATTAKKTVAKKATTAKKTAAKKVGKAKKTVAKKATATKKAAAQKKTTAKKAVAKKITSKKNTTAKKLAAKKPVAKKTAAKKPAAKKTAVAVKKPVSKKK